MPVSRASDTAAMGEPTAGARRRLRPDLIYFPLDDELVVFSDATQSLLGLNAAAAEIVNRLAAGSAEKEVADVLAAKFRMPSKDAVEWVNATLEALSSKGLLEECAGYSPPAYDSSRIDEVLARRRACVPPYAAFEPLATAHYRLLETNVMIRYGHGSQKRIVDSVIGHLASDQTNGAQFVIDIIAANWGDRQISSSIYRDGMPEAHVPRLSMLGPAVKSMLWTASVNAFDHLLNLHAGVVGRGGRCILLPAAPGSGKSSITAALTHAGLGYYSDEVALVERGSFQVRAVPLAICVKESGWTVMSRYHPQIDNLPIHRREDGKVVRYLAPDRAQVQTHPAQVSHIFFPRYAAGEATRIEPLSRSAALGRLMDQCVVLRQRLDPGNVRELVDWISRIDSFDLTFSSLDEAVALVKNAADFN